MKYAVVSDSGKQYKVSEGDVVEVAKLALKPDDDYVFPHTLLIAKEKEYMVGTPFLDLQVKAKVIAHVKKEKIRVAKFKAKARYRRVSGHRSQNTKVKIEKIG